MTFDPNKPFEIVGGGFDPTQPFERTSKRTGTISNVGAGINEGIASTLGAPVDLLTGAINLGSRGVNAVAGTNIRPIENPVGGSDTFKGLMGLIGADPRNIVPADRGEEIARAGGQGVGSAVMPGLAARALPQAAGGPMGALQGAIGSGAAPGAAAVSGVAGMAGNMAEQAVPEPYKPMVNTAAQMATGVGAGLAQRGASGIADTVLGVGNVTPERAGLARRMIDEYKLPLTAMDIQPYQTPTKWVQSGLDYVPFSGAPGRQRNMQEAVNAALLKSVGGDAMGATGPRFGYEAAGGAIGRMGNQYNTALDNVTIPFTAGSDLTALRSKIGISTLAPHEQKALFSQIQSIERVAKQNGGNLTGREYQAFRMEGSDLRNLMNDANPIVRNFAKNIKSALDQNFATAAPPGNAELYNLTNNQYRQLMALSPEIAKGEPGNISAQNLQNAANRADKRRAFDTGQDALGDLGDAAKMFLRRLPESGTAPRAGVLSALGKMASGEFGPAAGLLTGLGAGAGAGVATGGLGIIPALLGAGAVGVGARGVNSALNSEWMRNSLLNRILNPQQPGPAIPPWMAGSIPASLNARENSQ